MTVKSSNAKFMLSVEEIKKNKATFEKMLLSTGEPGLDKLLAWMNERGYDVLPGATAHHSNYPGGLVQHTMNVARTAIKLDEMLRENFKEALPEEIVSRNDILLAALLHDLDKIVLFEVSTKNAKTGKTDAGKDIWQTQYQFTYKGDVDKLAPHAMNSAILAMKFLPELLSKKEYVVNAIIAHMGAYAGDKITWEDKYIYGDILDGGDEVNQMIFRRKYLAYLLQSADNLPAQLVEYSVNNADLTEWFKKSDNAEYYKMRTGDTFE